MKAVLMSIQPKWCEKIASGEKTIEVRKTRPKLETPFKCYIYCTIGNGVKGDYLVPSGIQCGKVIGEFVCDSMYGISNFLPYNDEPHHSVLPCVLEQTCLEDYEIDEYLGHKDGYGWHITDLKIYDKPKELSEFYRYCGDNPKCNGCEAHYFSNTECGKEDYCCSIIDGCKPIKRPPPSWCYVEELQE